jgi:hypothetical protein
MSQSYRKKYTYEPQATQLVADMKADEKAAKEAEQESRRWGKERYDAVLRYGI